MPITVSHLNLPFCASLKGLIILLTVYACLCVTVYDGGGGRRGGENREGKLHSFVLPVWCANSHIDFVIEFAHKLQDIAWQV